MNHQPMTLRAEYLITGAMPSKGEFEKDGKLVPYDNTKFYVHMPLSQGKGYATVEYKFGTSAEYERIFSNIDLPATAEVVIEQTTTGKGTVKQEIKDIIFKKKAGIPA